MRGITVTRHRVGKRDHRAAVDRIIGRHALDGHRGPAKPSAISSSSAVEEIDEEKAARTIASRHPHGGHPFGADVRSDGRRVRGVLRPQSGDRRQGRHRRGGGHHRRAVDRRAGHAAHAADVPHRRRGVRGHHHGSAARRGAVRGAQAQGPSDHHRRGGRRPHPRGEGHPRSRGDRRRGRGAHLRDPVQRASRGARRRSEWRGRPADAKAR